MADDLGLGSTLGEVLSIAQDLVLPRAQGLLPAPFEGEVEQSRPPDRWQRPRT
jgi:hypothetical protein